MSVKEVCHCAAVNLGQILCEVELFAQERFSHDWQVDWIDELESHGEVLDLFNQVHWDFLRLT